MSREIKFRVWDSDNQVMYTSKDDGLLIWDLMSDIDEGLEQSHTPTQYTGLKDKNAVEIYEGDIVNTNQASTLWAEVRWGKRVNGFGLYQHDEYLGMLGKPNSKLFEVIGNIYENPELLEDDNE